MPWVFAILAFFLGIGTPGLQSVFQNEYAGEAVDRGAQTQQKNLVLNTDDFGRKGGFRPDMLNIFQLGLTATEFQWPSIALGLKEDEVRGSRNFEQGKNSVSPVPVPGTLFLLAAGLAAIGIVRKRIKG